MKEIPAEFMKGCSGVKELYIPTGYEIVGMNAFSGCNLSKITTDNLIKSGTTEEVLMPGDNGEGTFTLPSSLKKICTGSFSVSDKLDITDVYVLATTAPVCEMDAFNSAMYFNNNSYSAVIPIHQGSYQKSGGTASMSVLHFPIECDETNVKRYTDPDRVYTLGDGLGTTDANGELLYWPNQAEFNRAYAQAVCGYTWNSWPVERDGYTSAIKDVIVPNGVTGQAVLTGAKETADARYSENNASDKANTVYYIEGDTEKGTDYRGWHQFVLTSYSRGKQADTDTPTFDFGKINDNNWWTICLPFGLTKEEIEEIYGKGTVVCTLKKVKRNYTDRSITLIFSENLMNSAEAGDVIKAGYAYMIKPCIPEDKTPSEFILSSAAYKPEYRNIGDEAKGVYTIIKTDQDLEVSKVQTVNGKEETYTEDDTEYKYKFIGSFMKYYIPLYAYFLAWDNVNQRPAYYFQMDMANNGVRNWNPYTCVITVNWKGTPEWINADPVAGTVAHWNTFTINGSNATPNTESDKFPKTEEAVEGNAKVINMVFGDNGGTTGVNTVHTANGTVDYAAGKIYNMNGQLVGEGGDLCRLAKGVYVINGKKYIRK